MELGFIGLGKMGGNMVERLTRGGAHRVVGYDQSAEAAKHYAGDAVRVAGSLTELTHMLQAPRAVWIMVPAGDPVDQTIEGLLPGLQAGDLLIDGGNSYFRDSQRRARDLAGKGIAFLDVGTSGGIWGLSVGYCMMIGGDRAEYDRMSPVFETLAPDGGQAYMGGSGAGHFVKMVHNGIEYGLMQAYAEGLRSPQEERVWARSAGNRRSLAARQRGALMAAGACDRRVEERAGSGVYQGLRG